MNDIMYEVTGQFKANWRMHECPTSQGDRYPIGEVELGFGIEALMAGSNIDGEALGEVLGDPMALLKGDLACGTTMVCAFSSVGECLWISPSRFHI